MEGNPNRRLNDFKTLKHKGTNENLRQRRHEFAVELRKNKKENQLLKRRNIPSDDDAESAALQELDPEKRKLDHLQVTLKSSDYGNLLSSVKVVRMLLSDNNPPIDDIIQRNMIPDLVNALKRFDYPDIQFEAAWALTNMVSGTTEQTRAVLRENAAEHLVNLIHSPHCKTSSQVIWALSNIAADCFELQQYLFQFNIVDHILNLDLQEKSISFLRNLVWLCSNLCQGKRTEAPHERTCDLIPLLVRAIGHSDEEIITQACWSISILTDRKTDFIQTVLEAGAVPMLVHYLNSKSLNILLPNLRVVGNIMTGTDAQAEMLINAGVLPCLQRCLYHENPRIVRESVWVISNVAAGTTGHIAKLLELNIMIDIMHILIVGDFKTQREAAYVIANIASSGTRDQAMQLIHAKVLKPFCNLLDSQDVKLVSIVLQCIESIFESFENDATTTDIICSMFEEIGALDKLEFLQGHKNHEIYWQAHDIIDKYFSGVNPDDPNGSSIIPVVALDLEQ